MFHNRDIKPDKEYRGLNMRNQGMYVGMQTMMHK